MFSKLKSLLVVSMLVFISGCVDFDDYPIENPSEIRAIEVIPEGNIYRVYLPGHLEWIARETAVKGNNFAGQIIKFIEDIDMENKNFSGISKFAGRIEGNHMKILNLKIGYGTEFNLGLIHLLEEGGHIENLTIENGSVNGYYGVGSFVGIVNGSATIKNVVNKSNVFGDSSVGGLIGGSFANYNTLIIDNSSNEGTVRGDNNGIGGILGYSKSKLIITNSSNSGWVIGEESMVGGFLGIADSSPTIKNSSNSGKITGDRGVGGFVGMSSTDSDIIIDNGSNSGLISGTQYVGGIIGANNNTAILKISNSLNSGAIDGSKNIGGIVGQNSGEATTTIKESLNTAIINGKQSVGGIIGMSSYRSFLIIDNSSNIGLVKGTDNVSGFIGYGGDNASINITNSSNSGNVTGEGNFVGGVIGLSDNGSAIILTNVYSYAKIIKGDVITTGGIAGSIDTDSTVTANNSYWLSDTSLGIVESNGTGDGTYIGTTSNTLNVAQFADVTNVGTNFTGWDFTADTGIWELKESAEYPTLINLPVVTP